MLGDIHIAEPGALIGFAGQRVIQETIREQLRPRLPAREYLHEHGMVDMVVKRPRLARHADEPARLPARRRPTA